MHRNVTLKFDSSVKPKSIARQSSPRIKLDSVISNFTLFIIIRY